MDEGLAIVEMDEIKLEEPASVETDEGKSEGDERVTVEDDAVETMRQTSRNRKGKGRKKSKLLTKSPSFMMVEKGHLTRW